MKNQVKYFLLSIVIILLSSPLGYMMLKIIYSNKNLAGEFNILLNGFIHSFMLVGTLVFGLGLVNMLLDKK